MRKEGEALVLPRGSEVQGEAEVEVVADGAVFFFLYRSPESVPRRTAEVDEAGVDLGHKKLRKRFREMRQEYLRRMGATRWLGVNGSHRSLKNTAAAMSERRRMFPSSLEAMS